MKRIEIKPGDRFGRLVFINETEPFISPSGTKRRRALFSCDCGNKSITRITDVKSGNTTSCGCRMKEAAMENVVSRQDVIGKRFGRLTVMSRAENYQKPSGGVFAQWNCICDCGTPTIVGTSTLNSGKTLSCGCLKLELNKARLITHGHADEPLYNIWIGVKQRCLNPKLKTYHRYGGRGITICDEWLSYETFHADMSPTYYPGATLERIENNGNYCRENCKWIPREEQARNTRSVVWVEYQGKKMSLSDLGRLTGICSATLSYRISKKGMSVEDAVSKPISNHGKTGKSFNLQN